MMKQALTVLFVLMSLESAVHAQFAGGAGGGFGGGGANRQRDNSTLPDPAAVERAKRDRNDSDSNSTYLTGSILMNVPADEYVAVFGVSEEGKTPQEASDKMETSINGFQEALKKLGVKSSDLFVDFIVQKRTYAYRIDGNIATEEVSGFELKKNVSVHFTDKLPLDKMAIAAAKFQIYDLVKVDYIIKDVAAIQTKLQLQTMEIVKRKAESYTKGMGVKLSAPLRIVTDKPSVYYPTQQYDSYQASESENLTLPDSDSKYIVRRARRNTTTFFNPLSNEDFDVVINPVVIEPVVQFTTYVKVQYALGNG